MYKISDHRFSRNLLFNCISFTLLILAIGCKSDGSKSGTGPSQSELLKDALRPVLKEIRRKDSIIGETEDLPLIPGVIVGVNLKVIGEVNVSAGNDEINPPTPMPPDGVFEAGSVTKSFTSALILSLAQEGRLDLNAPISTWFDYPNGENITLTNLLQMTSGIPDFYDSEEFEKQKSEGKFLTNPPTPEQLIEFARAQEPLFEPGTNWDYSNTNYIMLGLISERVGGAPYHKQLRERFIEPLGLVNTYLSPQETGPKPVQGYFYTCNDPSNQCDDQKIFPLPVTLENASDLLFAWSAGAIISTSDDLNRWMKSLVAEEVLAPEFRRLMQTVSTVSEKGVPVYVPPWNGLATGYGMGLIRFKFPGVGEGWGHPGNIPGFATANIYFPDADIGVVFMGTTITANAVVASSRVVDAVVKVIGNGP